MSKKSKSSSLKSYKCTCHRIHKNKMFTPKCKIHKHIYNKNNSKTVGKRRQLTKTKKNVKSYPKQTIPKNVAQGIPLTKGISQHINKKELLVALQKIKQCDDMDKCAEIKNYITMNVCDINSTNKDIFFYLSYKSHTDQESIYHKIVQFSKTM